MLDYKKILWENVSQLMVKHYGRENLTQCATDTGLGPGTMSRIKAQETSIGIDTLEALGTFFKLEPYELLIPGLQSKEITVIHNMRGMSEEKQGDIVKISSALAKPNNGTHGAQ